MASKLPPVRKRTSYADISSDDLTFALFYDRVMGEIGAMREDREERPRIKTLDDLLIALKHGKHDQSTHGRKGRAGRAGQAAYQAARSGGASHAQALAASRDATQAERATIAKERADARVARLNTQAARARSAANGTQVTPAQRDRLLARADRLEARARGEKVGPVQKPARASSAELEKIARRTEAEIGFIDKDIKDLQRRQKDLNRQILLSTDPLDKRFAMQSAEMIKNDIAALKQNRDNKQRQLDETRRQIEIAARSEKPSEKAYADIRSVENKIRPQRFETAHIVDGNGKIIIAKDGEQYSVGFSTAEVAKIRAAKNVIMTHNHPRGWDVPASDPRRAGNSFSPEDVDFAASAGVYEMRAVTPAGRWYVRRPPQGWDESTWQNEIRPRYERANQATRVEFTRLIGQGRMTPEEAEARHHNHVWTRVFGELGYDYGFEEG